MTDCECLQHAVAPIAEHMNQTRHFFEGNGATEARTNDGEGDRPPGVYYHKHSSFP